MVLGDSQRLAQIFDNLLDNAVKFTPSGGRIETRLSSTDKWLRIDIIDTGSGIAQEFIGDLFKTFAQGHALASRYRRGLGLGLAIVKDLVERHRGKVEAFSSGQGCGATFSIHLPIYVPGVAEPESPSVASRRGRILVVDDSDDTREALRILLESWGLDVADAADGVIGLERVETFNPDIVLCDLSMPVMDGWTMASELRAKFPTRRLPLVAMSGHGTPGDVQQSFACGFQAHLVKPCEATGMIAVLNRFLPAAAIKLNASGFGTTTQ
jgi:two-component system, sensor histidine kinase